MFICFTVICFRATEGHSVAVPGLGSMRFGLRSDSVADVNKVAASLITTRRVILTLNTEIKKALAERQSTSPATTATAR
ncbi:MAG: hypothetical protein ACI3X9_01595 [Bacteroidaceae bacterium]